MFYSWTFLLGFCVLIASSAQPNIPRKQKDLRKLTEAKIGDFKLRLHQKLQEMTVLWKALIEGKQKLLPVISSRPIEIESMNLSEGCTTQMPNSQKVFAVTSNNALSVLKNFNFIPIHIIPSHRAFLSLQAIEYGQDVWLVAQHINKRQKHFIKMYKFTSNDLDLGQRIDLLGPSVLAVTKVSYIMYAAVVSTNAILNEFRLYQCMGKHFDEIFSSRMDGKCSALDIWTIHGTVYIALSFTEITRVVIKRFVENSEQMSTIQLMDVEARIIKYFEDSGNHYLTCGTMDSVMIYWWAGSAFHQKQEIVFDKTIKNVAIHKLLGEVLIAVVFSDEVTFLLQDDSARYVTAGNVDFNPTKSLKKVLLWKNGGILHMLSMFEGNSPVHVHQIDLKFETANREREPKLEDCIESLYGRLKERSQKTNEIKSIALKAWSPSAKSKIRSLKVYGEVRSPRRINISSLNLDHNISSPNALSKKTEEMLNIVKALKNNISVSVSKSRNQQIESKLAFRKRIKVGNCTIVELKDPVKLNEVNTSRFHHVLKKTGHQTFESYTRASKLSCTTATTEYLNGKKIEDYILLNSAFWNVTGNFQFANVSATSMVVNSHKMNGLDIKNFVLASKEQDIYDVKKFETVSAAAIQMSEHVNEIHLNDTKWLVYSDFENFTSLNFISALVIKGNLNISTFNGYGIFKLFSDTVKRDEKQFIHGNKTFKNITVKENMKIDGRINNIALSHFMTVNTDQKINYGVTFLNNVIFSNIVTDSVNGVDLSEKAVVRSRDERIDGVKTFLENLNVSNISMKDGVSIDFFDPSVEMSKIYKHNNTDDVDEYVFYNMTIGNINTTDMQIDANYFPILKDLDDVWLRTHEQKIPLLETSQMAVNRLQVSKVNDITMEDLVTINDNVTINGFIEFADDVSTRSLNLIKGANLSFSPEFWNPDVKVKILNNVTIETAVLESNLRVDETIENFESGFLHVNDQQTLNGTIEFEGIEVKELTSKDLTFQFLNNMNFSNFVEKAVVMFRNRSINNKHFKALNGSTMNCEGTLNNNSISRVVTKNTKQKIKTSWTFLKAPVFTKLNVKSFFDDIRLRDIVYIDEVKNVSNKHFKGDITADHLNVTGNISNVNITHLQLKSFKKSEENVMEGKLTIRSNLTAKKIQILEREIDGIELTDLIRLNESENFEIWSASSSIVTGNITVTGLINGCLRMSELEQHGYIRNITARTKVGSLMIVGNLEIKYLNGANIPDWISLLKVRSLPIMEGNFEFENLKAGNIKFLESVNNIIVDFLMDDAVKKNLSEVISSNKTFHEISARNITIEELTSNTLCSVNISEIFELYVNKSGGDRPIILESGALGDLSLRNVTVNGHLNNLKLPTDVVMSNTSEVIVGEVLINNTVNASAGLTLSGEIDGINLEKFLKERITLNATETTLSHLNFTEDVILDGSMKVNGTVNSIRIEDIVNKLGNQAMNGTKTFAKLEIMNDVTVNGSINGIFLDQFLWSTRNESLKEVHLSTVNASSLICNSVNGLNVTDFYNYTHNAVHYINDKLDDFTASILSYDESLMIQRDAAEHPLTLFSHFELQEVLNVGIVQRFLPIHEYGVLGEKYELETTQMVMWIENTDVCRKTKSLIADVSKTATFNITRRLHGKIFPFSLREEKEDVVGFYVQAEHSRRCSTGKKTRLVIKTIYSDGVIEKKTIVSPAGATLHEIQLLELDEIFLIIGYNLKGHSDRIFVYQYEALNNTWSRYQTFHMQNLTSLDLIFVERDTASFFEPPSVYLSVTGDRKNPGIAIYEWDFEIAEFYPKTNMSTSVSSSALWMYHDQTLYLFLAKEMTKLYKENNNTWVDSFTEPLEVYTLEDELLLNHTVNLKGVRSLEIFILADEAFILASSNHMGILYVLQLRGYNGFEVIQEIPAPSITEARAFTVDNDLYLALNSETNQSRILKASIRGERFELD